MFSVALTGNIAAGKSIVLTHFAAWGATVVDADRLVHDVQRPGSPVLDLIARRFGDDLVLPNGTLDRTALRRRVMAPEAELEALNAIVHPEVQALREVLAAEANDRGDLVLVNDIPLLFEALDPGDFDAVVLVDAPADIRLSRLMDRRGLSCDEAARVMASQMPAEQKRSRSDCVIDNEGSLEDVREAAWQVWRSLRARAAAAAVKARGETMLVALTSPHSLHLVTGAIARYADAGLEVDLLVTPSVLSRKRLEAVQAASGARTARTSSDYEALSAAVPATGADVVVVDEACSRLVGRATIGSRTWTVVSDREPPDTRDLLRLDVRPWSDAKAAVAQITGDDTDGIVGRENFRCGGDLGSGATDLFDIVHRHG